MTPTGSGCSAFLEKRARAQARIAEPSPARASAEAREAREAAAERKEVFERLEEGIASLRKGERKPQRAGRAVASHGSLRFRALAAREARERQQEGSAGRRPGQEHGKNGMS